MIQEGSIRDFLDQGICTLQQYSHISPVLQWDLDLMEQTKVKVEAQQANGIVLDVQYQSP